MLPDQLTPGNFSGYPPEARELAIKNIVLLQRLPLAFVPLLLRELIVYDWKFPAERTDLTRQFRYLGTLPSSAFQSTMAAFARLKLGGELERTDWVNSPAIFSEQLSAHLWATHQIDAFRAAAVDYVQNVSASAADPALPTHRLGIAAIGQGVTKSDYQLFRKLRPLGVYYTKVQRTGGIQVLVDAVASRAEKHPAPYGHWYIDGAASLDAPNGVTQISYNALSAARAALQNRMQKTYEAAVFDPEAFRTMLARMKPEEAGFAASGDQVLNRFQLSLLTEGSGTQVFSTTFVQWAAREALRRAQPWTLFARFAPRQRENQMNELLAEHQRKPELDPQGSLIDADMGAFYTWLNQQRLAGEDKSAFLAWFEDHEEAVAIAPGLERGKRSDTPIELADLIARIA
ncbi:MAG TPA: hypothetical protein VK752_14535 [Bryobacteraceae bacterium]|jgi:hypothetical protein|nr:hypothetical protein [Bryobacteraceae bacterium]